MVYYDGTAYQLFGSQSDTNTLPTTYLATTTATSTTAATATLAVNQLYLGNYTGGQLVYTLPATCPIGSVIEIIALQP